MLFISSQRLIQEMMDKFPIDTVRVMSETLQNGILDMDEIQSKIRNNEYSNDGLNKIAHDYLQASKETQTYIEIHELFYNINERHGHNDVEYETALREYLGKAVTYRLKAFETAKLAHTTCQNRL